MSTDRVPYQIALSSWGRFIAVSIEPRQVDKPSRTFRTAAEAMEFAEDLSRVEGWPIVDRRQSFDDGPRAA